MYRNDCTHNLLHQPANKAHADASVRLSLRYSDTQVAEFRSTQLLLVSDSCDQFVAFGCSSRVKSHTWVGIKFKQTWNSVLAGLVDRYCRECKKRLWRHDHQRQASQIAITIMVLTLQLVVWYELTASALSFQTGIAPLVWNSSKLEPLFNFLYTSTWNHMPWLLTVQSSQWVGHLCSYSWLWNQALMVWLSS